MIRTVFRMSSLLLVLLAIALQVTAPSRAQAQSGMWSAITASPSTPIPLREYGAIFDRENERYIIFCGFSNSTGPYVLFNDVWELSVAGAPTWSHMTVAAGPLPASATARSGAMTRPQRLLLFGGYGRHCPESCTPT